MVTVRDVWRVLRDGKPRSAVEIVREVGGGTTAAVTARVRDLRKPEWGEHVIMCERDERGAYVYRLVPGASMGAARNRNENGEACRA